MKIKITTEQYNTILMREHNERSNKPLLNENILMGFSKLIGVPLTGQNKLDGEKALNDIETINKIKDTFEDKSKLDAMIDSLKEKGMENPNQILTKDPQKIIDRFNKLASDKKTQMLGSDAFVNLKDLI